MLRAALLVLLPSVLAACGNDGGRALVESFGPVQACSFPAGQSRWAPDDRGYRETARVGDTDEHWFAYISGVSWMPDELYVFDVGNARVARFAEDLSYIGSFGREGEGPGEFPRLMFRVLSTSPRHIGGDRGRLVTYDGRRLSLFDSAGEYLGNLVDDPFALGMTAMTPSLRLTPAGLVFGIDGHDGFRLPDAWTDSVTFRILRWAGSVTDTVVEVRVARAPRNRQGASFLGPHQARPLWDAAGVCVVASDGASPWLVVASLDGEAVDTLGLDLPDREPPDYDREGLERLSAQTGGGRSRLPDPTAILRIRKLILDPDGYVWILPIQPNPALEPAVEVLRISLVTGRMDVDTVPAFPVAFGPPGVYYATLRLAMDQQLVVRYELEDGGDR